MEKPNLIADKYTGKNCKLDGKPAKITGRLLKFAIVSQLPDGLSAEFSWDAVKRIMERNAQFKS